MRWEEVDSKACSISRTVEVLGDAWTVLVLREVFLGVRRFDDIQEHIGVSRSVLTKRLSSLIDHGILERRPYQEPGDRVRHEYRLTDAGKDLGKVLAALMQYGDERLAGDEQPPAVLRHRDCGEEVRLQYTCAAGHRDLTGRELALEPAAEAPTVRRSA